MINKKIHTIMTKVKSVTKDKRVGSGSNAYMVVTYDKLLTIVREHLIDEEVIIIPNQDGDGKYTELLTAKGGKKWRYDAIYNVSFIAIEDGSERSIRLEVSADTFGDDKAPSKAVTIAVKNAILKIFSLESGDEAQEEGENKINSKQITLLQKLVTATNTEEADFLAYYGAATYADFKSGSFQGAIDSLQAIQKKAKK